MALQPPSNESIDQNKEAYKFEDMIYTGVPRTRGILTDLKVIECKELPPNFNTDECYSNFSSPKGLALIINNRRFVATSGGETLTERYGSDIDCLNVERLLSELDYEVRIKSDLNAEGMWDAIATFARDSKHGQCHSAIVVVLTHGKRGSFYGTDGHVVSVETFVSFLDGSHCPLLKNKPKVFLFQACRGERLDPGVADRILQGQKDGNDQEIVQLILTHIAKLDKADTDGFAKIPNDSDILLAFSTTPGYVSWRSAMAGSWFIQAICEIFALNSRSEDLSHLLTMVSRRVSEQFTECGYVQMPEQTSRLKKKLYFLPGLYRLS